MDKALGLSISRELNWWRRTQWYSGAQLREVQQNRLDFLLFHCAKNIPYYRELLSDVGQNRSGSPFDLLKSLPLLTKKIVNAQLKKLCDPGKEKYKKTKTSGSTGERAEFYQDRSAFSSAVAIQAMFWEWAGFKLGDRAFQNGMSPERGFIKTVKDKLLRVRYLSAFDLNREYVRATLLQAQKMRGSASFLGYASALFSYASSAKHENITGINLQTCVSWGDKLFSHYRKIIKAQFKCDVFDTYGASEGLLIAAECEQHSYHQISPHIYLEVLDAHGEEVEPGEIGHVVVTRLDNFCMPLLRYTIGDLAIKENPDKKCACGRQFPLLKMIVGRNTDVLYTPENKPLIVHFFTGIMEHFEEILQFQVVETNEVPITIRYIPAGTFTRDILTQVRGKIYERANEEFPIVFQEVDEIFPSPSGKPQIIIKDFSNSADFVNLLP